MKKVLVLLSAFVFLWGCEKVGADEPVVKDDDTIKESVSDKEVTDSLEKDNPVMDSLLIDFELPAILYASVSGDDEQNEDTPQTRTYVGIDRKKVLWHNGDAVSYFAGNIHNARYAYTGEDGQSSVELAVDPEKSGNTGNALLNSQAVYPYDENVVVKYEDNMDKIELTYPTTQKYGVNSFGKEANIMVAAGKHNSDDNLYFRNACGYLIIKLYGQGTNEQPTTIRSITLSSVSGVDKIAGKAVIVAKHDAAPVITMADDASTAVTLDCNVDDVGVALGADAEHATEFWFCLPPVTFTDGIKITVTDVYGNVYTKQTSKTVNIGRNTIQPMAAIEFVSNAPAATKLWYTRSDNSTIPLEFYDEKTNPFDAQISRHYYDTDLGKIVIEFSSPLTTIKEEAFRETIIASITLPEGVTTIEEGAFESSDLTEITVPGSMMNIGINAFWDCTKLSSVTFLPSATKTPLKIGCLKSGATEWGPFYDSPLSTVNLNRELVSVWGDGEVFAATAWDEGIFANKHYESVASASVTIGSQVETLPDYMFYGFPIQTLTIPGTLKTIGNCVFDECKKLTSLIYEPSPTGTPLTHGFNDDTDDDGPFYASPLTSVHLNREINYTYSSSAANAWEGLFGKDSDAHALTDIIIGEQVKTLSPYMFAHAPITSFVIPATVTSIERNVFDDCKSLTSITFENSSSPLQLKSQGDSYGPFYDSPLATIVCNRPIDYRKINGSEFNPTSDVLGVFAISSDAKSQISDGTDLTIGQAVTTISNHMFYNLPIKTITIPGSVNTIGNNVFNGCNSLTEITFEPSPTGESLTIGYETSGESENLFQDYCKLTTLNLNRELIYTFGDSYIDSNSEGLFGEIPTLTSVTLGEQVKTLHKYMFANSRITELTIPGSVTTIANDVFHNCIALASLTFSPSPTGEKLTIGYDTDGEDENLFQDYCPLTTLNLDRELNYTLADSSIDTNSEGLFGGISTLTNVTLGDQVKTLHKFMFAGTGIKSINLNKVTTIGNYAFYNDAALESVNLGNVTTIGMSAFEGVSKVTSLDIPASVTSIADFAFKNCSKLATLNFLSGSSDLTIGFQPGDPDRGPFYQSPLTTIAVNRSLVLTETYASACDASDEGIFSTQHGSQSTTISLGGQVGKIPEFMFASLPLTSITIPATVTEIGNDAFTNCTKLKSITFEESTKPLTIGFNDDSDDDGPFYNSPLEKVVLNRELNYTFPSPASAAEGLFGNKTSLTSVTLGDNVKTLSPYMFANSAITSLDLNKVTTIGKGAFEGVSKVTTLNIPATVTSIGDYAFKNWESLATLNFLSGSSDLTIGYQPGSPDRGPFYQSPLTTIAVNRSLVLTEAYASACDASDEGIFSTEEGSQNTTISLGGQVAKIPEFMFASLPLTSITIPATVTEIGNDAFTNCTKLKSITFAESSTPLTIGFNDDNDDDGPFYDSPLEKVVLNRELNYTFSSPASPAEGLFGNKTSLTNVTLGDNVKTLSPYMFANSAVKSMDLNKVTTVGDYVFYNNAALESVNLRQVTTIGKGAFEGASKITTLDIPASVTSIADFAFKNCSLLATLNFVSGSDDLVIGFQPGGTDQHGPFYQSPLTDISVNRSLVLTEAYAAACDAVDEGIFSTEKGSQNTTISLGGQVGKIPEFMFASLPLTSITIPATVTEIGNDAFTNCTKLKSITFEESPTPLTIGFNDDNDDDGPFFDSPLETVVLNRELNYTFPSPASAAEGLFGNKTSLTSVTLGENVRTLTPYMFANSAITTLDLQNVTTIGKSALEGASKITSLDIPASVTSIDDFAFKNCSSLATLNFLSGSDDLVIGFQPEGTDQHGPFYQSPLTTIAVNRSLVLTEAYANACDDVDEGIFSTQHGSQSTTISLGGQVGKIPEFMFSSLPLTSITIPATVTEISNDAFSACNKLSSITFAASAEPLTIGYNTIGDHDGPFIDSPLTTVVMDREIQYTFPTGDLDSPYEGLFGNKTTLTSVTLGDNVQTLSPYMFANSAITSLDLNKVTTIGKSAFEGVSKVTALDIPATVTSIADFAFKNWTSLATLKFLSGSSDLTIGFQPGSSDSGPFYQSPLTSIEVNRSLVLSDDYAAACDAVDEGIFSTQHGTQNTTISLGGEVGKIPEFMFASLPLTSITIPATVTEIGNDAFANCTKLKSVNFEYGWQTLTIGYNTVDTDEGPFIDSPLTDVTLNRPVTYTFPNPDTANEGLFGGKASLTEVNLGDKVKNISDYMFANTGIQTISLQPTNVETIGKGAFSGSKLGQIIIPYFVKSIGVNAFENCDDLAHVEIQSSSTALTVGYQNNGGADWGPFYDSPLKKIILGREINYVNGNGQTFTPVEASDGFFTNEESATINDVEVTIYNNVRTISNYMFSGLKMNSLEIPSGVTEIKDYAFYNCNTLASISIPNSVTKIGVGAFWGCSALTDFTVPASVVEIGNDAFTSCAKLKSITFDKSPTTLTIGFNNDNDYDGPFYNSPLETVVLNRELNYTFPSPASPAEGLFGNKTTLTSVILGENVKTLSPYMFANSAITTLDLKNVTTIGKSALEGASKITSLDIPASVTSIDDFAFKNCSSLATLNFLSGSSDLTIGFQPGSSDSGPFYQSPLTTIDVNRSLVLSKAYADACDANDEGVFSTMHGSQNTTISLGGQVGKIPEFMFASLPLASITIPATVTEIGNDAFNACVNLTSVTFEESATPLTIGYNTVGDDEGLFADSPNLASVVLNRGLNYTYPNPSSAAHGLFGNKTKLTSVTLGGYVKSLSDYMFANTGITTIDASHVETIGKNVFSNSKLASISLGSSARTIGTDAFNSTKLTSITIPSSVNSIGVNAFVNCDDLQELIIADGTGTLTMGYQNNGGADWGPFYDSPLKKIVLGREIRYVDGNGNTFTPAEESDGFFANEEGGSVSAVLVDITDNVKAIQKYMFAGLKMTEITIPSSVTEIKDYAFYNCSTLASISIPNSVTKIGVGAFWGCSALADFTFPASVNSVGDNAFYNCTSLSNLTFASGANPLTLGYQPSSSDERGPFYQSPLKSIKLDRQIAMTENYTTICDQWDEGIFSNSSYNAAGDWVTDLVLGPNVKTILKYMFAGTRVQQLHIPETVDEIGVNVVENNEKLNAIIFYDTKVRPNVEHGAFGVNSTGLEMDWEHLDPSIEAYPPGKYQYYVFVPFRKGRNYSTLYNSDEELQKYTYWDDLHAIMVDDKPNNDTHYYQPHEVDKRHHESRYLDVTGYEWYRKRYYYEETITPPTM